MGSSPITAAGTIPKFESAENRPSRKDVAIVLGARELFERRARIGHGDEAFAFSRSRKEISLESVWLRRRPGLRGDDEERFVESEPALEAQNLCRHGRVQDMKLGKS